MKRKRDTRLWSRVSEFSVWRSVNKSVTPAFPRLHDCLARSHDIESPTSNLLLESIASIVNVAINKGASSKMVAGKGNPQALARAATSPKLPPLPKLRVRKPDRADANPCLGVMSSVLGTATNAKQRGEKRYDMQYQHCHFVPC